MTKIIINNQEEMAKFAKEQAKNVKNNDIFALNGTLGSGKTFFAKYFISSLVNLDVSQITSPTFNIYSHYQINDLNIYHFDLYRLKHEEELENIGFYDLLKDGVCLIEWPEIAQKYLTNNVIKINFNILGANKREVIIN
ncbi:tRNA (adenosine(37)-N6)-threonylcarbamoyltransferase complex ATPase subunit type 1 TsaE [Rickettsiales bacterium]|nr:tRNA (adenosine(37)-N6)-threonylcarbamoyltransferase complex ATPase subunit type 1 TsaE [Rickettsiales bacterium]